MALDIDGFEDLQEEIDELANQFEGMAQRHDRNTVREAIETGVTKAFDNIVEDAKQGARRHVPDSHADRIDHDSEGWVGDMYKHEMGSNSIIVASHEFGSGLHSLNGRGTIDVPGQGYIIPKPISKGPLRLRSHPNDSDENPIIVEYVIHPGVKPKRFMHRALMRNESQIQGHVGSELSRIMRERGLI